MFDKQTGKVWEQAAREVAHEKYFNEAALGDGWFVSVDPKFQRVENGFAPVLEKLNAGTQVASLTPTEQGEICYFFAVQYLRTPAFYSMNRQFNREVRRLCSDGNIPEAIRQEFGPLTDESAKLFSLTQTDRFHAARSFSRRRITVRS